MAGSGEDVGTTLKKKCHCLDVADFSSLEDALLKPARIIIFAWSTHWPRGVRNCAAYSTLNLTYVKYVCTLILCQLSHLLYWRSVVTGGETFQRSRGRKPTFQSMKKNVCPHQRKPPEVNTTCDQRPASLLKKLENALTIGRPRLMHTRCHGQRLQHLISEAAFHLSLTHHQVAVHLGLDHHLIQEATVHHQNRSQRNS